MVLVGQSLIHGLGVWYIVYLKCMLTLIQVSLFNITYPSISWPVVWESDVFSMCKCLDVQIRCQALCIGRLLSTWTWSVRFLICLARSDSMSPDKTLFVCNSITASLSNRHMFVLFLVSVPPVSFSLFVHPLLLLNGLLPFSHILGCSLKNLKVGQTPACFVFLYRGMKMSAL
jgi:hypothetical protein